MTDAANAVPPWLRSASALSWRLLVVGAAVFFTWQVLQRISLVVLSVVLGLFPAALLWRPVQALKRRGWRPLLATWAVLIVSFLALVGVGFLVVPTLVDGLEPIVADVNQAFEDLQVWLVEGPLGLSQQQIDDFITQIGDWAATLGPGLLSGAAAVLEVITGLFLALIVVFFILKDGDRAAARLQDRLSPVSADRFARGGRVAWTTMGTYIRGLALVGLVDAVAIAIGLLIVGVPLVVPLAILVFLVSVATQWLNIQPQHNGGEISFIGQNPRYGKSATSVHRKRPMREVMAPTRTAPPKKWAKKRRRPQWRSRSGPRKYRSRQPNTRPRALSSRGAQVSSRQTSPRNTWAGTSTLLLRTGMPVRSSSEPNADIPTTSAISHAIGFRM